jgi:hydrogenase/urease accessory protein HupE
MKSLVRRSLALACAFPATFAPLFAHPGHDDGHELTWELSHLAEHPLATVLCLAVTAAAGALVWRSLRPPGRSVDQSLRGSQVSRGK